MENIKELFAEWGLWSLVEDISDDGDGTGDNLQLTKEGLEAHRMIEELLEEREIENRMKIKGWKTRWEEFKDKTIFDTRVDTDENYPEEYNVYLSEYDTTAIEGFISQELDKAREEGFNYGVEKTVGIIQKELDELLLQKGGENYWVGDILRDCGYTVETILPKNMKGYLVKLKTKEDGKRK